MGCNPSVSAELKIGYRFCGAQEAKIRVDTWVVSQGCTCHAEVISAFVAVDAKFHNIVGGLLLRRS